MRELNNLPLSEREGKNLTRQFQAGLPFTNEKDWKQFGHTMHLHYWRLKREKGHAEAEAFETRVKNAAVAILTGPNALRNEDGYFVIGNRAYGKFEAEQKAYEFSDYLVENEQFPPSKYPHRGPKNTPLDLSGLSKREQNYYRQNYPDVTERYEKDLKQIVDITERFFRNGKFQNVYPLFIENFGNNKPWDLQVNHSLPGQAVIFDSNGDIQYKDGFVKTTDEFAIYNNKLVKAGYLSNYAYGYASAAGGLEKNEALTMAWLAGSKGEKPFSDLNEHDNNAIGNGYKKYWDTHKNKKKAKNFFRSSIE